jgi:hypothetical protein
MSTARNMVRALRDSGDLIVEPPEAVRRRSTMLLILACALGAMIVFFAVTVVPHLGDLARFGRGEAHHANFVKPD